jgi:hydrogenase nickel incorporation protein HypB
MSQIISVQRDVSAAARQKADDFRRMMTQQGTLVVNLMSSPGAGKTSLLSTTARHFASTARLAILVGDIATDRDAQRLAHLAPTVQLTTGGACHLELSLVQRGWEALATHEVDFLFIENVGNLVCPASHDLGEHLRVVMLSATEGDDKPAKYPKAFRTSRALVISKIDLLPHVPFSVDAAIADARAVQPNLAVFPLSVLCGDGIDAWCDYLLEERRKLIGAGVEAVHA